MQIKKFVGATLKEATEQMKTELGAEAIVLNTRRVTANKFLNFLGKDMLEITAAIDEQSAQQEKPVQRMQERNAFAIKQAREAYGGKSDQENNTVRELRNISELALQKKAQEQRIQQTCSKSDADIEVLRNEVEEMRNVLTQVADHLKYSKMPSLPLHLQKIFMNLLNNDVEESIAADLVQAIYGRLSGAQLEDKKIIEETLWSELSQCFSTAAIPAGKMKHAHIVALVGPTGVGKTTTIAKLAAIHKLVHHQDVGLITADTYRIGAIEQLRTFAGIADIPMQVVYKPSEIQNALKLFRKKDIVFIDTVGRSQRAKKELGELRRLLEAADPDETHLVVNASANRKTLLDIVDRFQLLKPNRILISKIDEALTMGNFLGVVRKSSMPISYVTNGQGVPDDILSADPHRLAGMISNGILAHA
jgi:flagellar biosynthesis protein FlhF